MKDSARAAEDARAHNRLVAAFKKLVGEDNEKIQELEAVRTRRMHPAVAAMREKQVMADIAEGLVGNEADSEASADSLEDKNVAELKEMAKTQDVPEYYKLNRQELLEALS